MRAGRLERGAGSSFSKSSWYVFDLLTVSMLRLGKVLSIRHYWWSAKLSKKHTHRIYKRARKLKKKVDVTFIWRNEEKCGLCGGKGDKVFQLTVEGVNAGRKKTVSWEVSSMDEKLNEHYPSSEWPSFCWRHLFWFDGCVLSGFRSSGSCDDDDPVSLVLRTLCLFTVEAETTRQESTRGLNWRNGAVTKL